MALLKQLQHLARGLWRSPMFTAATLLTLAVGIGANTAIFSVIEGVLLKPLPYPHPEQLMAISHSAAGLGVKDFTMAPSLYFTYREESRTLQDIGMWSLSSTTITGLGEPEQVQSLRVTDGVLSMLGAQPILGRAFTRKDDSPGNPETAILTYGYWQRRFGGAPAVIGKTIVIDGEATQVIGVLPQNFRFLDLTPALYRTFQFDRGKLFLGNFSYQGVARMKPGVTVEQARADLSRLVVTTQNRYPAPPGYNLRMFEDARFAPVVRPLKQDLVGELENTLWVLMGTIGMVLLIACANVANLLLVRAGGRQQELAIRAALGASSARIARDLLAESLTLGLVGGAAGVVLAYAALPLLISQAPGNLPRLENVSIDPVVLLFALAVSLLSGALFGLIPALKYAGPRLGTALRAGGRTLSHSRERHRTRNALVIVQVALALVLLIGSGLMIRTFQAMKHVQPGFTNAEQIQTLRISIPRAQAKEPVQVVRMQEAILHRIQAIPGVTSAGMTSIVPMSGQGGWNDPIFAEDRAYAEGQVPAMRRFRFISPELLAAMGTRLIAGRNFSWADIYQTRPVVMVSENLAREMWRDPRSALGKRVRQSLNSPWREVIGVVADVRDDGLNKNAPTVVFYPLLTSGLGEPAQRAMSFMVRSSRAGTEGLLKEIRQAVWSVNSNLPLAEVRTLGEVYDKSLARTSFTLLMLAAAGAMALLLGIIGIYGVIAYSVSQRTREIGIRIALGARHREVTRLFVRHGLVLTGAGIACGLAAAAALSRLMSSLLFEVSPVDPTTYAAVSLVLVAAALLATYLPARGALGVDPVEALRAE